MMKYITLLVFALLSGCTYPPSQVPKPNEIVAPDPSQIEFKTQMTVNVEEFCYKGFKYGLVGSGNGRMAITIYNSGRHPMKCEE